MKAVSCNQINGGHRKILCPGAPQGSARYQHESLLRPSVFFKILYSSFVE